MEGSTHLEVHSREAKQIAPDMTREHRITITNNGAGESMKAHNSFEECTGNRDGG
jgi:hypothetical protein